MDDVNDDILKEVVKEFSEKDVVFQCPDLFEIYKIGNTDYKVFTDFEMWTDELKLGNKLDQSSFREIMEREYGFESPEDEEYLKFYEVKDIRSMFDDVIKVLKLFKRNVE